MFIDEADAVELKAWIVKRLENISDADSDVLADYVLALIRADSPEPDLRITAIESLDDFLKNNTSSFVNGVFSAIHKKSYLPGYVSPRIVSLSSPLLAAASANVAAYGPAPIQAVQGGLENPKKRAYHDIHENGDSVDSHYVRGDRQMKHVRRGGKGVRADMHGSRGARASLQDNRYPFPHGGSPPVQPTFPGMPLPPQGLPFNPNDPMAAIIAMQAMGLPPIPVMPTLPHSGSPSTHTQLSGQGFPVPRNVRREKCTDYDTQGYCAKGDSCNYEHGTDRLIVPGQDEYDPKNSLLNVYATSPANGNTMTHEQRTSGLERGRGRGRGDRGGALFRRQNNRAEFSQAGPNHDHTITTIVVEQIPEETFDEDAVRNFFSQYGSIEEITMQPYKRLALVKYIDYVAAKRAYDSPKVIFDNRFVKVYWYKPGGLPTPPTTGKASASSPTFPRIEEQGFDKEDFERNALAAQKKLENKKAQLKDMDAKRKALEKQKEELALKQAEEKRKLLEKLKARGIPQDEDVTAVKSETNGNSGADDGNVSAHTKALRQKVAELEAEAKSLGLDSALSDYTPPGRGRGRGRASYRGWKGFTGRISGYDRLPGRGRGSFGPRGGGNYNLDNRTKKVRVSGVELTPEKDEALRHHLLGIGEFEAIEALSDKSDTQVITFKDRPTAETFMYGTKDIPSVGKLELSWYNAPSLPPPMTSKLANADGDVEMRGGSHDVGQSHSGPQLAADMDDYDVADDDDRNW